MSTLEKIHQENKRERIRLNGELAEEEREQSVETLRLFMESFYEHGGQAEIDFLIDLLGRMERHSPCS